MSLGYCQPMLPGIPGVARFEPFSGTWPPSGMMRNGTAFLRPPLVPRTSAIGFSSSDGDAMIPTPVIYDSTPGWPGNHYKGLGWQARHGERWETPSAAVALRLDRHFIGIELNPDYIAMAERRLDPLRAQGKLWPVK